MSDIGLFLNSDQMPAPNQRPGMRLAKETRLEDRLAGPAAGLQPIMDALRQLDPSSREFARQLYNEAFQDADIGIRIPDLEEYELNRLKNQKEALVLRRDISKETVLQADSVIKSMPQEWKLQQGITTDNLMEEEPSKFLEVARGLGYTVDRSMLALAGFEDSDTDAAKTKMQRESKEQATELSQQAGMLRDAETIKEAGDIFEGPLSKILGEEEERNQVDLFTFDTDVDEVAGARALLSGYDRLMRQTPTAMRKRAIESFIKMKGDDIRDAMEEAQTDEKGSLLFGTGSYDADPDAIWFLGALSARMARDYGSKSMTDMLALLGVPATDLDPVSFNAMGEKIAGDLGEDFRTVTWPALMGKGM